MRTRLDPQDFSSQFSQEVCPETGSIFFDTLVRFLAQALEADCVFLAEFALGALGRSQIISVSPPLPISEGLERELDCRAWLQSAENTADVRDLASLPSNHPLAGLGLNHCLIQPLLDAGAQRVGLVAALYKESPEDVDLAKTLLGQVSRRASRELERLREERLLAGEKQILKLLARNAPLGETLATLARMVEEQVGDLLCSILLLDRDGIHLRSVAAPSLPRSFSRALDGIIIGPEASACGTAAYLKERIVCADIARDPLWSKLRDIALRWGLRACWSSPICADSGMVLGTFACYCREARAPQEHELRLVDRLAYLAQVAIEHQRDQEDRWESDKQLRLLAENATEVIMAYDMNRRLIYVNPAVKNQTGYSIQEMREKHFVNWVHPEDNPRMMELWERLYQGEGYSGVEFRIIAKDGTTKWILGSWNPLMDERGRQIGVQGREIDITKRKQLEEQLQQSHKMEAVGRLAGGVAHDFNNLLTAIIGHSELVLQQVDDSSPLRMDIEEIKKAGERAALLTRQLLAFSRKQVLQPVLLNLNDLLDNMSRMLRRLIREDIRLMTSGRSSLWLVKADPGQMQQVILNLAINARDAMPHGGSLTIKVSNAALDEAEVRGRAPMLAGQYAKLTVSDSGEGMDDATRARIFEPFFTTKELGKGTGLGLSTVYGIIKQSGGYIWVQSQPGKGTTFEIYLPRVEEGAASQGVEAAAPEPVPPSAESKTILVVEDDDAVRRPICRMLEMNGYQVLEARNPDEALKTSSREHGRIDLVLTDMVMPWMSGREMASRLAATHGAIRILYMSGHIEDPEVLDAAIQAGGDFIQKPFSGSALTRKVQEILGRPKG